MESTGPSYGYPRRKRVFTSRHIDGRGTAYSLTSGQDTKIVKTAFGFHRQAQDWGEAAWTARDLR